MRMICQECDDNTERTHEQKLKVLVDKGFCLTGDNLTSQQFAELVSLLYEYNDAFATDIGDLPNVKGVEYEIKLQPGTRPKRQRQYRYSPELRQVIRDQLKQWEKAGIAEEGDSYWPHPVVLVKKKSEVTDSSPKYRMCLDLRELNKCVMLEQFPLPTFENILDCLGDPPPCHFTLLDALHGYLQLNVTQESSKFLGVESDEKSYIFKRLPFGLATSPYAYQKLMNSLLSPYQFVFAAAYLDDLLVYSRDWESHKKHLRLILERTRDVGLRMKPEKCVFAKRELRYLGMLLGADGIYVQIRPS